MSVHTRPHHVGCHLPKRSPREHVVALPRLFEPFQHLLRAVVRHRRIKPEVGATAVEQLDSPFEDEFYASLVVGAVVQALISEHCHRLFQSRVCDPSTSIPFVREAGEGSFARSFLGHDVVTRR